MSKSIRRDADKVAQWMFDQTFNKDCDNLIQIVRDYFGEEFIFKPKPNHFNRNYCLEIEYAKDAILRYAVDQILDDAGVLMPSAEEVWNVWMKTDGLFRWYSLIDKLYYGKPPSYMINKFKSNPAYFKAYVKLLRAIEAREDGVDVDLDAVVESCTPTEKEGKMSQTKTFRVKTGFGNFSFEPYTPSNGKALIKDTVRIICDCGVNGNCYTKESIRRIIRGLQLAVDYKPDAEDIEDI